MYCFYQHLRRFRSPKKTHVHVGWPECNSHTYCWILITLRTNLSRITPPVINWNHSNLPTQWDTFKRYAQLFFFWYTRGENRTRESGIPFNLGWFGEKGRDIRATWTDIRKEDTGKIETYYQRFQDYVQPKLNPVMTQYQIFNEIQGGDSIEQYVTRLRLSTKYCSFPDPDEIVSWTALLHSLRKFITKVSASAH